MPGRIGIRANQGDTPRRVPRIGRPDLLAANQPTTVGRLGPGPQSRQIRASVGLTEQLAPELGGVQDRRHPSLLLLDSALGQQGRTDMADPYAVDRLGRPGPGVLHVVEGNLHRTRVSSTDRVRP